MGDGGAPNDVPASPGVLVIDAMNVIGSRPDGWWNDRDGSVRRFAARLERYTEATGVPVELVVDGRPIDDLPAGRHGSLAIHYAARRGRDAADDRIVELLGELEVAATVVTADRDLRARAAERGADLLGPKSFLQQLADAGID